MHTTQQPEIIEKRRFAGRRQVLADSAAQEQDQDDRRGDPEGPVQVGVALEHVEEVGAGEQGGPAARQDSRGVDIEELRVEGHGPEEALR